MPSLPIVLALLAQSAPVRPYSGAGPAKAIVMLSLVAVLYFVPTVFAFLRGRRRKWRIAAINLFLGWTFIGWIVAMLMNYAYEAPPDGSPDDTERRPGTPRE